MSENALREEIARFGKSMFDRGLTGGSSGNISVRIEDGWLMTPTGSSLGNLDPARISKLGEGGELLSGDPPTKEHFLHRAMYEERASAGAIVHLHSTHSVAVSCLPDIDPANVLSPLTAYYVMKIGRLPLVPYYRPGDEALGDAIRGLAGKSLEAAVYATEELEETAKLHLLLHAHDPRVLTEAQIEELERIFPRD